MGGGKVHDCLPGPPARPPMTHTHTQQLCMTLSRLAPLKTKLKPLRRYGHGTRDNNVGR